MRRDNDSFYFRQQKGEIPACTPHDAPSCALGDMPDESVHKATSGSNSCLAERNRLPGRTYASRWDLGPCAFLAEKRRAPAQTVRAVLPVSAEELDYARSLRFNLIGPA